MTDPVRGTPMLGAIMAAATLSMRPSITFDLRDDFYDLDTMEDRLASLKRILPSRRLSRKAAYPQGPTRKRSTVKASRKANVRRMQAARP